MVGGGVMQYVIYVRSMESGSCRVVRVQSGPWICICVQVQYVSDVHLSRSRRFMCPGIEWPEKSYNNSSETASSAMVSNDLKVGSLNLDLLFGLEVFPNMIRFNWQMT